jgi:glycine cleavage system aminomethyltransferase T
MESDVTIGRISEREFLVVTAGSQRTRDLAWLRSQAAAFSEGHVGVADVSSGYTTLSVMGPRSRELLSRVTPADLSNEKFPFATMQEIEIGYSLSLAFRMTFVGELGWELHVPTEQALGVYDALFAAGGDLGLRHAGYVALNTLRLEAGYRDWGADVSDEDTPLEAGLGFTVAWNKSADFIGRAVLEGLRKTVPRRRLVQLALLDSQPLPFGTEPVWRDGKLVGYLRSAGYGHTLGCGVGMGYLACGDGVSPDWLASGKFEVEVAGARYPAIASLRAFYDADRSRVKGIWKPASELVAPALATPLSSTSR